MRQREHKACLVGFRHRAKQVGLVRIADYEEAGEIVLIVLDMVFPYPLSHNGVQPQRGDGSPSVALVALNKLSSSDCIFSFHSLEVGMVGDVVATFASEPQDAGRPQ